MTVARAPRAVEREIREVTGYLVETGLATDQNVVRRVEESHGVVSLDWAGVRSGAGVLKRRPYSELYAEERARRAFTAQLVDGALLQISYRFERGVLSWHRLAYLPAPDLAELAALAADVGEDELLERILDQRAVGVPVRFDFDNTPGRPVPGSHPVSHLTLGQHDCCRIPVTNAMTPHAFVDLIVRAFYGAALEWIGDAGFPRPRHRFASCICREEEAIVHVTVPV